MRLSVKQRIEILMMLGYGDRIRTQQEVCNIFNQKYPDRSPITRSIVSRIETKLRETGNVNDKPKSGRPKVMNEERCLQVLLEVEENPNISSRQLSANHNVEQRTILRVLNKEKYHPYKIQLVHELSEDDPDRRTEFCDLMMIRCNMDPAFLQRIVFSDEATFHLNGSVNRQNCRYWARENPRWMEETHTQYPVKLNVWAGLVGDHIIGPYFIEGNLTGAGYLELLQNVVFPRLVELFPNNANPNLLADNIWFQQDGAPPHYAVAVRNYLNTHFPNKWIGRQGQIEWPPRSPDLSPLDYFLWGYLKSKVYHRRPQNLEDLRERIQLETNLITREVLRNVQQEFLHRLAYCQEVNGGHFEHLIN